MLLLVLPVEEHRSLGVSIIIRLDNGAFVGLIYELLVFYYFNVEIVPPMGFLSLLYDKFGDDAWYCNLLHFLIQGTNST